MLTDGASTGGEKSLRVPLENLKQSNVNIFTIGIGRNINKRELEMMATAPVKEHVFYVATMQELQTLLTNIGESACKSKCIPGILPCISYIGMCDPKGYGFAAVLVLNRLWFLHCSIRLGMFLNGMEIIDDHQQKPFINVRATVPAATVINRVSNFWSVHK